MQRENRAHLNGRGALPGGFTVFFPGW